MTLMVVSLQLHAAEVVDIRADTRFGPAIAQDGMTHPASFECEGVYMTAPADPSKEVVLFVHGANGSPRDFVEVAGDLDTSRQQAWFAYYATGNSIARSAQSLADDVRATMKAAGVTHLRVFAHSMGGLVAWRLITDLQSNIPVAQFVSVNTPWDGDAMAQIGAWFSPSPLAIWIDLSPGSNALRAIWKEKLAAPFTLVYTVEHERSAGDGTVSVSSELQAQMRQRAASVVEEFSTHSTALHGSAARRLVALLQG